MKVILIEDVENIGKRYEIKEVKNGYARNFLIPQNLVKAATKKNLEWVESQKEIIDKKVEEDLKKVQELTSRIDGVEVAIPVKVGPEGQLFEGVNAIKIAEKLKLMGFDIKKSQINLEKPLKEVGEFPLKITLDHNLEAEITVIISEESSKATGETEE